MTDPFEQLKHLALAGANVLHVTSHEWERVQGLATGLARDLGLRLYVWSQSTGEIEHLPDGSHREASDTTDPLDLLRRLHSGDDDGIWLLEDFQPFLREEHHPILRWIRELTRLPSSPRKLVLLSTPCARLPIDLQKEVPTVELELPGTEDLRAVLAQVADRLAVPCSADPALLDAARGLTVMEARLAFGKAAARRARLDASAVPDVAREKERIIKQSEVLEYYPSDAAMADVGGLEELKRWLESRGRAFGPGAKKFGLDAPKGVLLLGIQGCGKSLLAKAVAATWSFPLLRFDLGKVFGGIVGQSEGNIRMALQVAEALAPCVLWIDEIEKGLAGMGSSDRTDGGTTARVVGSLLTWMQEKRAPVFVVATANRIDMLPPELLRKGRFDEIFFVDLPTLTIRQEILGIHLQKKGRSPADFDLKRLATLSVGFSGAELEEAVREGLFDAFNRGQELKDPHIEDALKRTFPLSRTMREQIEDLRRWAKVRARPATREEPEAIPSTADRDTPRLRQEAGRNPFIPKGDV